MPSIQQGRKRFLRRCSVLNLIITGMPSIQVKESVYDCGCGCFKPYYNWNAFNTKIKRNMIHILKEF